MELGRALAAVVVALAVGQGGQVHAAPAQHAVVLENPSDRTPDLVRDDRVRFPAVYALEQAGTTVYAGGEFATLEDATRTTSYARSDLAAFDARTGAVSRTFAPRVDGSVWAVRAYGSSIYVGGTFSTVDGVARRGVAKLDATTGRVDPAFRATTVRGDVTDLRVVQGRLVVAGQFAKRLAALDLATGADTGYLDLGITGTADGLSRPTRVYRFAVTPDQSRLLAIGDVGSVSGQPRARAFMVDLGPARGTLSPWYYPGLTRGCSGSKLPAYLRDVDFSPDGSWFVLVATGGIPRRDGHGVAVCDGAARFETRTVHPQRPTWMNYTGGDTLHSVAVTGAAVYVSGHQRWLDNPYGNDSCGQGCVPRPGIGAIDPVTGKALPWNPGKTRGVGGKDLLATSEGLWVGSDGARFDGEYHYGIAFAPLPAR